jgi:hypothetical protein
MPERVRLTILVGSTLSGLVLGLFVGLGLLALLAFLGTSVPGLARAADRLRVTALVATLVAIPLAGAVLGWLEGRAKLR